MDDTLLFLHVLSAAFLVTSTVIFSSFALGAQVEKGTLTVGEATWNIGGLGTIVFGIWLALRIDGYEIWDAWVLIAIALWFIAYGASEQVTKGAKGAVGGSLPQKLIGAHWFRTVVVVLLLADMVWKPWA